MYGDYSTLAKAFNVECIEFTLPQLRIWGTKFYMVYYFHEHTIFPLKFNRLLLHDIILVYKRLFK